MLMIHAASTDKRIFRPILLQTEDKSSFESLLKEQLEKEHGEEGQIPGL